jgi:Holliday junction resolvase
MVDSKSKGTRAESDAKKVLIQHTKLNWQRTPGSGALNEAHKLKGDIYLPDCKNRFCIEVKHYKDDHLTSKILTLKTPQLLIWWKQALDQAEKVGMEPLLLFKFDRSKWFVAFSTHFFKENDHFTQDYRYLTLFTDKKDHQLFICQLEDWLVKDKPEFILNG